MLPFFGNAVAVFALLYVIKSVVGDNIGGIVLTLLAGLAAILALLIGFNALNKRF